MAKNTAKIDNWVIAGNCLWGNVTEHTVREFDPNNCQRTSSIVRTNERDGTVETENTIYTLGTKAEGI